VDMSSTYPRSKSPVHLGHFKSDWLIAHSFTFRLFAIVRFFQTQTAANGSQGSSFVEARKVGCHGLAVFGKAVLFDMSALQSHGLVEDSKTVAPQIDKMICPERIK